MGGGAGEHFLAQRGIKRRYLRRARFHSNQATVILGADFDANLGGVTLGVDEQALHWRSKSSLTGRPVAWASKAAWICPVILFFAAKTAAHQLTRRRGRALRASRGRGGLLAVGIGICEPT